MATRLHSGVSGESQEEILVSLHVDDAEGFRLRSAVYSPSDEGLFIRFVDDLVGFIPVTRIMTMESCRRALFEEVSVFKDGYTLSILLNNGEEYTLDHLALRSLVDEAAQRRVAKYQIGSAEHVGQRIRNARQEKGWTQMEFEQRTGIDQALISKMERGQHYPRVETLERIAAALSISVISLMMAEPAS